MTMVKTTEAPAVSDLPIYPIRTAARLTGVDARRLRTWESRNDLLRPARTRGGQRLFSQRDLDLIRRIKHLIDDEGAAAAGVRLLLEAERPRRSMTTLHATGSRLLKAVK